MTICSDNCLFRKDYDAVLKELLFTDQAASVKMGAFNSDEVQRCRKRRENFRIIYTQYLKSGKLLTLIIKENHSNFGANMSATAN